MSTTTPEVPRQMERDTIYVGRQKPVMAYVLATLTALANAPTVNIKARGAAISFAVDVAQITIHRFARGARVAAIKLDTEQLPSEQGGTRNVSTIDIELTTT